MYCGVKLMNSVVDHIAILVDSLEEASKWYVSYLGGVVTHKQSNYHRLKLKNTNIALLDRSFESSKPHVGILCENIDDLPSKGERVLHRDGTTGVYMKDLDGNYLEFIHYGSKNLNFIK